MAQLDGQWEAPTGLLKHTSGVTMSYQRRVTEISLDMLVVPSCSWILAGFPFALVSRKRAGDKSLFPVKDFNVIFCDYISISFIVDCSSLSFPIHHHHHHHCHHHRRRHRDRTGSLYVHRLILNSSPSWPLSAEIRTICYHTQLTSHPYILSRKHPRHYIPSTWATKRQSLNTEKSPPVWR